jgi:hypothetical protein
MLFLSTFPFQGFAPQFVRHYSSTSELLRPNFSSLLGFTQWKISDPIPKGAWVSYLLDSPHQEQFWIDLKTLFSNMTPGTAYAMLVHPSSNLGMVTLGPSILVDSTTDLVALRAYLEVILAQHEESYEEQFYFTCQVRIKEIKAASSTAPTTQPTPGSIGPAPIEAGPQINTMPSPKTIVGSLDTINSNLNSMSSKLDKLYLSERRQERRSQGYEKLAESLAMGIERVLTLIPAPASVTGSTAPIPSTPATTPVISGSDNSLMPILDRLTSGFETLTSTVSQQGKTLDTLTTTVGSLSQSLKVISEGQNQLTQLISSINTRVSNLEHLTAPVPEVPSDDEGDSTPPPPISPPETPPSPAPKGSPFSTTSLNSPIHEPSYITPMNTTKSLPLESIVTADLEALLMSDNSQICYMAAWYGFKGGKPITQLFNITSYANHSYTMLREFWMSLINHARGSIVYFHNWAGYDIYFSLAPLLSLHNNGFTFIPTVNNGKMISVEVVLGSFL